jgi:hypothetical protein
LQQEPDLPGSLSRLAERADRPAKLVPDDLEGHRNH